MVRQEGVGLSFLDVLCSAMGAMVILAVIFSIVENPVVVPKLGDFILVRARAQANGVLGVVIQTPVGDTVAIHPTSHAGHAAILGDAATSARCWSGSIDDVGVGVRVVYLEVRDPMVGKWWFRPYPVSYSAKKPSDTVIVEFEAWTRNSVPGAKESPVTMAAPGHEDRSDRYVEIK